MGKTTNIAWTDVTWNIAVGCTKVDGDCKYCYMYRGSLNDTRYDPKVVRKTKTVFRLPLTIKEPSRIFVSSLTDVFHPDCDSFRDEMWEIIRKCPQHTFQILTKRPERIADQLPVDWGEGWENVWLGTSIGSNEAMKRVYPLLEVPAKVRFVSFEPLWERIDMNLDISTLIGIDWAIIGGESGNETGKYRYRPCELDWIQEIAESITSVGNRVFIKQLGTYLSKQLKLKDRHGGDMTEWPEYLQIREFPKKEVHHG